MERKLLAIGVSSRRAEANQRLCDQFLGRVNLSSPFWKPFTRQSDKLLWHTFLQRFKTHQKEPEVTHRHICVTNAPRVYMCSLKTLCKTFLRPS